MTRRYAIRRLLHAAALALCLVGVPAGAQDGDGWSFQLTPYAFLAGLDGSVAVRGNSADVEASFGDLFDRLDFGAMLNIEVRRERWGLWMDAFYVDLGDERDVALPVLPVIHTEFDSEMFMGSPQVSYRLTPPGPAAAELAAGIRCWHLRNTLTLSSEGLRRRLGLHLAAVRRPGIPLRQRGPLRAVRRISSPRRRSPGRRIRLRRRDARAPRRVSFGW